MRGAAMKSAKCDDRVAGIFKHVGGDEFLRGGDRESADLISAERGDPAERIDAGEKTNFRFEDIAHAGQHFLMKEHVGHLFIC